MAEILYFFRKTEGINRFKPFCEIHLILLGIALIGCIFIFNKKKESRLLEIAIGLVLLFQQISLYAWYFIMNYKVLSDGLPLYHCRIAILTLALGLLFKKDFLIKIGAYWGIFGSIAALIFINMDSFAFPHITQFSYFIGHVALLWGAFYVLVVKKIGMSKIDYKNMIVFTTTYHILMYFLDKIVHGNYGYMASSPIGLFKGSDNIIYGFIVIIIFNLVLTIEYLLNNRGNIFNYKLDRELEA